MLRRVLLLLITGLLAVGCGGGDQPRPEVTFTAGTQVIRIGPTHYCTAGITECVQETGPPVTLTVPAGMPVRISVPDEIAATPWQVAFRYRDATGTSVPARSSVFAPETRDYTLILPAPTDKLTDVEVQQYGTAMTPGPRGPEFVIRANWVPVIR